MTDALAPRRSNRPQRLALHPLVYAALIGSVVALFLIAWAAFSGSPYAALQLGVVAVFLAMFVGVPWMMSRAARARPNERAIPFGEWREGDFQTWTGALPAGEAALMILSAPAAVVTGIGAISAVAYLAAAGVL